MKQTLTSQRLLTQERRFIRDILVKRGIPLNKYEVKDDHDLVVGWLISRLDISVNKLYDTLSSAGFRMVISASSDGIPQRTYQKRNVYLDIVEFEDNIGLDARLEP